MAQVRELQQPPFFPPVPYEPPKPAPAPSSPSRPGRITRAGRAVGRRLLFGVDPADIVRGVAEGAAEMLGGITTDVDAQEAELKRLEAEAATAKRRGDAAREARRIADAIKMGVLMEGAGPPDTFRAVKIPGGKNFQTAGPIMRRMPDYRIDTAPSSAAPAPAARRRVARALSRLQAIQRQPLARALGLGFLAQDVLRGRKKRAPTIAQATTSAPTPALGMPETAGLTPFDTRVAGYVGGFGPPSSSSSRCDCKPKKRGPRRKCLERGAVVFKTGRNKGRPAGTKCIRYAT